MAVRFEVARKCRRARPHVIDIDCDNKPGRDSDPCFVWAAEEGHGRAAVAELMAAYTAAGTSMRDSIELEMVTRSRRGPRFAQETGDAGANYRRFQTSARASRDRVPDRDQGLGQVPPE